MNKKTTFGFQMFIIGGFFVFFYLFFALATSIYQDYRFQSQIREFEQDIDVLAQEARQKPEDIAYYNSPEWKDKIAKETLNLLNPGEKMILLPSNDRVVQQGEVDLLTEYLSPSSILNQSNPVQWREYFFGQTLLLELPSPSVSPKETEELQSEG